MESAARDYYLTDMGDRTKIGARFDLVLANDPFCLRCLPEFNQIQPTVADVLPPAVRADARIYVGGLTASVQDLASVMQHDRERIQTLVVGSVLLVLIMLLRRVVVSVYLMVSVLFSYFVTLGVCFALFAALDPHGFKGIDWKVAIFLFTILVAVGEDYNIFLMTRIDEETPRHGPMRGISEALVRTGPIISSCGIIMAGTFASLLIGGLTEMKQLGFALAFGVLLDTFVVRPILVPAFLVLLRGGRFCPWVGGAACSDLPASFSARVSRSSPPSTSGER
jgi:RND superfamily putative drug exporter